MPNSDCNVEKLSIRMFLVFGAVFYVSACTISKANDIKEAFVCFLTLFTSNIIFIF